MVRDDSISDSAVETILPYELRIGVSGHRKLNDAAAVAEAVVRVLDHVQQTLESAAQFPEGPAGSPRSFWQNCEQRLTRMTAWVWRSLPLSATHTPPEGRTPVRWTVISPLAKGADRLVARAVLNRPGARLEVITPFPVDEYRRDFTEPDDRADFEQLFALDPTPVALDPDLGPPNAPDGQVRRNEGYFEVGGRVVDASEILIVVWNGQPAEGRGGTADIVQYAVERGRVVLWINAENPAAPARQITGFELRETESEAVAEPVTRPLPTVARQLSPRFHRLAAYNRDAAHDAEEVRAILERNAAELHETAKRVGLPASLLQPVLEHLLPHYARADQLAIRYQQLYVRSAMLLYGLAAFAVTVVVGQVLFFPHALWLISFEIAAMLLAVMLLRLAKIEAWHEKWLNDRHLAERLRTAMFTVPMGRTATLTAASSPGVLPFYQGPEGWFIEPFRPLLEKIKQAIRIEPEHHEALKRFLIEGWIGNQAAWHARNAVRKRRSARRFHITSVVLFITTLIMATLHLVGVGHEYPGGSPISAAWHLVGLGITFLAITLPAWAAAVHAVGTLLDRERIATRSERMAEILDALIRRTEQATTLEQLQTEIARAEEVTAAENQEWLASLSFHELVLPV
ncbi:MAG: hypothetical protein KY475_01245 [Planctomycetes bacterium]|nr:hypothetical protein [Planctomycetota bacterium]